jgi:predicted ATP-dependent endonuclease of OLD family
MFFALQSLSEQEEVKIQPLVCTHSISMIDRAPPRIINHVVIKEGVSHVEHLTGDDDQDIKNYLDKISEISGISNSSIFFERCFLIVEGETEESILPLLYKKVTNKSLPEDGVVLTNLETNNTWKSYLKLLSKNKRKATVIFLDSDIQTNSRNRITPHALIELGFDNDFYDNNVILVGTKEFEDIFSNEQICTCLNSHYPKVDGESWVVGDIQALRSQQKFSKALLDMVGTYQYDHGIRDRDFKKPEFGIFLGLQLSPDEIRQISCVNNLIRAINRIVL